MALTAATRFPRTAIVAPLVATMPDGHVIRAENDLLLAWAIAEYWVKDFTTLAIQRQYIIVADVLDEVRAGL